AEVDLLRIKIGNVVGRRHEVGDDVDAHGGDDEGDGAERHHPRIADALDDGNGVHDRLTEHFDGAGRDDHGDDGEYDEIDRQPEEIPDLHRLRIAREAGKIAEIEQQRGEVGDDQHR